MEEVDYKRVREIMWTDKPFRLRELPAYFGFPLLIKVTKGSDDMEHKEKFAKGEILRIDGEERQRRVIAADSKGRHWSFPVHIGAKFDVPTNKKERCKSMYMSEIVEAKKLPKKFCFAKKDDIQMRITGEEHSGPLVEGDFKTKEVTSVRIFKANRISDGDIRLKVVFLPAYMDVEVVIATKFACEPDAYWEEYMDAMTRDINKKVNLNMYRGKSDIQIYEFSEKTKKSKAKTECLYEEQAPTKIVSVGSIIKQRPSSTKTRTPRTPSRTPSTSSDGRYPNMRTFSTPESEPEPEEPKRAVKDILNDLRDKDESEMTEEEIRVAKHRRRLLAMFAKEEEEEEERRRSQIFPDGATCDVDEVDGDANDDDQNDNNEDDDDDDQNDNNEDDDADDDDDDDNDGNDDDDDESVDTRGEGDGDVLDEVQRPRSPGDGSTFSAESENNGSVYVDDSPAESFRQKPRIPTRRTPGLSHNQSPSSPNLQPPVQQVDKPTSKSPPPPPLKPKPALPGQKPTLPPNKPAVPSRKPALNPSVVPHVSTKLSRARVVNSSDHTRFANIQDFPANLRGLTIDDMCKALELLCLDKYEAQIRDNKIDGEMASELSEDMLKSDLGLSGLEAKKLYKFIHHNWRPV